MKRYNELTPEQQEAEVEHEVKSLLESLCEGLRFDDKKNGDDFQQRVDKAIEKAEEMRTPWFAHEYIMDDPYCKETITLMAKSSAEDAMYDRSYERVIHGII